MRSTVTGLIIGVLFAGGLSWILHGGQNAVAANSLGPAANMGQTEQNLTVFTSPTGQQLIMVDKQRQVMSVYHVEPKSGQITLKSVRNFRWDLELDHFNGSVPLPEEIRAMLKTKS